MKLIEIGDGLNWIDPKLVLRVKIQPAVVGTSSCVTIYYGDASESQRVDVPCRDAAHAKEVADLIVSEVNASEARG